MRPICCCRLVQGVRTNQPPGIGRTWINYSVAQSYLRHDIGDESDVKGGVFVFLHFTDYGLAGDAASGVSGTARYEFAAIPQGAVIIIPTKVAWHYTGVWGPAASNGSSEERDGSST